MTIVQPLYGHTSPETAFVVADYPYGFKLRCSIRYWIETHPKHGSRFMSQTTNPKKGDVWNKPKASTYVQLAACLYLDEQGYVQWTGLTAYSKWSDVLTFVQSCPKAVDGRLHTWVDAKVAMYHRLRTGEAHFTINNVKKERTPAEQEDDQKELDGWLQVREAFKELEK